MTKFLLIPLFLISCSVAKKQQSYPKNNYTKHVVIQATSPDSVVLKYHVAYFDATEDTRAWINNLTVDQQYGEDGDLSTTHANIFFLFSKKDKMMIVCFVYWQPKDFRWHVMVTDKHKLDIIKAGNVVFSKKE